MHDQLRYIFSVFQRERLVPSGEPAFGWLNNMFLSRNGHVSFFDFGAYCECPSELVGYHDRTDFNCTAAIRTVEAIVLRNVLDGGQQRPPPQCTDGNGMCWKCKDTVYEMD